MKDAKFVHFWKKTRNKGVRFYVLKWSIILPAGCVLGKMTGEYIFGGILFKPFYISDYLGVIIIVFVGVFLAMYTWTYNERRYKNLMENANAKSEDNQKEHNQ